MVESLLKIQLVYNSIKWISDVVNFSDIWYFHGITFTRNVNLVRLFLAVANVINFSYVNKY